MSKVVVHILGVLLLLVAVDAFADERLFAVDGQGKVYEYGATAARGMLGFAKATKVGWKEVDPKTLGGSGWAPAENARVTANGTVEVDFSGAGNFSDSGLRPPPPGMNYNAAVLDSEGNLAVTLGGNGKGFNYKVSGANGPILAFKMEWQPGPFPAEIREIIAAPNSNMLLAVGKDNVVYQIDPATSSKRSFNWEKIDGTDGIDSLYVVEGKVVAHGPNKGFVEILNPAESIASAKAIDPPPSGANNLKVMSNREPAAKIQNLAQQAIPKPVVAPVAQAVAAAPQPPMAHGNAVPAAPKGPPKVSPQASGAAAPKMIMDDLAGLKPKNGAVELGAFVAGIDAVMNDDLANREWKGENVNFIGRDKEADETVDVLARIKGKNPVLLGEPGVGKTTVAEIISQMMRANDLPPGSAYDSLRNGVMVQTTAGKISSLAKSNDPQSQQQAMEAFIKGLRVAEEELGRPVILYIDEMHTLSAPQLQALKPYLDSSSKGVKFIGSTTNNEFGRLIKDDDAARRRLQAINVPEFDEETTIKVLKESWIPKIEKQYAVTLSDEAIRAAVREAPSYIPTSHRPEGPFKLLQDVAVATHRKNKGAAAVVEPRAVFDHLVKATNSPLNPYDRVAFADGLNKLRADLRETVVDQERVTDAMVDLWEEVNEGLGKKSHRTILVAGPTGAGKTFSAQTFAKKVLGSADRMLEIDATKYETGGMSLNSLVGAPPGTISSGENRGILPEFLDGKGRGQNVIVINEIDKASPDFLKAIMEMLDSGKLQAGDGKTYHLGKSLVVFTTNKGDEAIYPRGQGRFLSQKDLKERLDNIGEKEVRGYFMQPDGDNLYDNSKKSPASVLQRIDRAVAAAPPSFEGAQKVAAQEVERVSEGLSRKFGYSVKISPEAARALVNAYYVPEDGIRNVNRQAEIMVRSAIKRAEKENGQLARGAVLQIGAEAEDDVVNFVAKVEGSAKEVKWLAPNPREVANPMADAAQRKQLLELEDNLGKHVIGQPDFVATAARTLRAKAVNSADPKPAVMLALGPTGTGKTEVFKAIALEKYGSEGKIKSFDMGKVKWEGDLSNIFGSSTGIIGSGNTSPFEKFLQDFPQGGVIVFDEIGNMGGGHGVNGKASNKEDLLKVFYSMLDEGTWTSPHGIVYDLRKYTIGFTSNEGQELFANLPADDLRLAAWKEGKSAANLRRLLKSHGWPEALIARLGGNIALAKPLLEPERALIAKKLVGKAIKQTTNQHKFKSVNLDPEFLKVAAASFFSHEEGGRKLRDLGEVDIAEVMSKAIFDVGDPKLVAQSNLTFKLEDNYYGKSFHGAKNPPKRVVTLHLELEGPYGKKKFSSDVMERAAEKRLVSRIEKARVAYHEAAHAVVNDPRLTGQKLAYATVKGEGNFGGYARYENLSKQSLSREDVVARIGMALAGMKAEEKLGFPTNTGWTQDLNNATQTAERAVGEWGLSRKPLGLPTKDGKVDLSSKLAQEEIQVLLAEGDKFATERVNRDWAEIKKVSDGLYRKISLDGDQLDKVIADSRAARTKALRAQGASEEEIRRLVGSVEFGSTKPGEVSPSGRVRNKPSCAQQYGKL